MNIFIIDFSATPTLIEKFSSKHQITTENKDGAMAYKTVGLQMPDIICINYKDLPSHGRQTAISIKQRKKTAHIPIFFIDGNKIDNEKVATLGRCISSKEISHYIDN
ncbi:MAG: hypothetical protein KF781_11430 [Chitinophagaceae bacterium]|nr:hypothetical protein [Chitinophagaceae bacterium]MCW5905802.1 hypothetical protein [Chitinophagaceae bacterium]